MPGDPLARPQLNRRLVISNIASLFSSSVLSQGMTSLALLFTARQLGAAGYGQYAGSFVLTSLSSILFSLGMDIWLLREGSHDLPKLGEFLGSVLAIKGVLGTVWFGLILLLSPLLNPNSFPVDLVRLSALSVWLDSMFGTVLTAYKASLRNEVTLVLESSSDGVWLLITLGLIGLGEQRAQVYILVRVIVLLVSLLVALFVAWRWLVLKAVLQVVRRVLGECFPYAASEFLAWASMRVDVLIAAFFLGEQAVGLYSPALGIVNALFLVPATVYMVVVPVLSNLFGTNVRQAWLTAKRAIALLLVIGIGMSLSLFVGAGLVVSLLGSSFDGSREILRILGIILALHSLSYGMAAILVAANQQSRRVVVQAVAVSINALLNLLIVRWAGIRGVAVVYVLTEVVLLVGYAGLVRLYYGKSVSSLSSPGDQQAEGI
jgi:O-antigen/teichoic acid export membrane protein